MEDILKELGTWAAENPDAVPQKFREALQQPRRPLHAPEDSSMSQTLSRAGPSKAYSGKPGKSLMDIVGTYLNCNDLGELLKRSYRLE